MFIETSSLHYKSLRKLFSFDFYGHFTKIPTLILVCIFLFGQSFVIFYHPLNVTAMFNLNGYPLILFGICLCHCCVPDIDLVPEIDLNDFIVNISD